MKTQLLITITILLAIAGCVQKDKTNINGIWQRTWDKGHIEMRIEKDSINVYLHEFTKCGTVSISAKSQEKLEWKKWNPIKWNIRDTSFNSQIRLEQKSDSLFFEITLIRDTIRNVIFPNTFPNSLFDESYLTLSYQYLNSEVELNRAKGLESAAGCKDTLLKSLNLIILKIDHLKSEILKFSTVQDKCGRTVFIPHDNSRAKQILFGSDLNYPIHFPMYKIMEQLEHLQQSKRISDLIEQYSIININPVIEQGMLVSWEIGNFHRHQTPATLYTLNKLQKELLILRKKYQLKYCLTEPK